jgi:hypothetical protein
MALPEAQLHREQLIAPFRPRNYPRDPPRDTALKRLGARLRSVPAFCRLRAAVDLSAGRLQVVELWVIPAKLEHESWDADEAALALAVRSLTIAPRDFAEKNTRIAGIGLHALARRYERVPDRSDRAVLADFLALAEGYPALIAAGGEFSIEVPSGGRWIGAIAPGTAVAVVRTFIGD